MISIYIFRFFNLNHQPCQLKLWYQIVNKYQRSTTLGCKDKVIKVKIRVCGINSFPLDLKWSTNSLWCHIHQSSLTLIDKRRFETFWLAEVLLHFWSYYSALITISFTSNIFLRHISNVRLINLVFREKLWNVFNVWRYNTIKFIIFMKCGDFQF